MTRRLSTDATPAAENVKVKRSRIEPAAKDAFRDDLFKEEVKKSIGKSFAESKPYLHCVIDQLCDDQLLRKVRDEIASSLHFTEKETDIYKVHQTGDLANLDGLPKDELAQLSHLFQLRNAMYSEEFRKFLGEVTDCGPLSGKKADMSINTYMNGCHLLNHDDVIGTRRVSYILYLPDPDEPWEPEYGGALELYPVVTKGTPAVNPTVIIPPKWNQLVMFTVQPGHSFHSVEEVVVDKPRLSISGWFHIPQEGEEGYVADREDGEAPSSLEQLQAGADAPFLDYPETDGVTAEALKGISEDDITTLSHWLNPRYLKLDILQKVSGSFLDESSIQLVDFLNVDWVQRIKEATEANDERCGLVEPKLPAHGTGEAGAWKVAGPPHKYRYASLNVCEPANSSEDATETLFRSLVNELFASQAFRRWLSLITQLIPRTYRGIARRFRPGLDYTLAWSSPKQLLDATLCFATRRKAADNDAWESDEFGGYECYMAPHDGEEDPAVYRQMEDDGALLTVSAGWNVLTLVLRDEGLMKFIKYVSARAPGSRWDVAFEYELPNEEADEEGDDE
ncbi:Oxoglutarate and iron-dependent oxygenase degradation C-term-domain-containing protein [Gaertneriomyces semiglobifer]|nr:Oxoglutarate and iron-dependent oxygenase degradation C-term-domain-containing protein [Gaertneriomyces semiglobifer]